MVVELKVRNLVKRFPRFELSIPSLELGEGVHLLAGPNGSGKTVFLKTLAGLLRPSRGRAWYLVDGVEVDARDVLPYTSIVTADLSLPNYTVERLISIYAGLDLGAARRAAREYGLSRFLGKRYYELSSGYRKRVQLAVALILAPRIIFLDEPFITVDSGFIRFLEDKILEMTRDRLIIIATHIPTRLFRGNNVILLEDGRLAYTGRIEGLEENMVEVKVGGEEKSIADILGPHREGADVEIRIKPLLQTLFTLAHKHGEQKRDTPG